MENIIDSFFVALGFKIDDERLDEFKEKAAGLAVTIAAVGAVAAEAAIGLGEMVLKVAEGMSEIEAFSELNEISARSVVALIKVNKQFDISAESTMSTLQSLNRNIGQAALGVGRAAAIFKKLHIEVKDSHGEIKTADGLLAEMADRMQGMSRQKQIGLAGKLGIDVKMVRLLSQGSDELNRLRTEAEATNPFGPKDYENAEDITRLWTKVTATVGFYTRVIAVQLFPLLKRVLTVYLDWFAAQRKAHGAEFVTAAQLLSAAIEGVFDWVVRARGAFDNIYDSLSAFRWLVWLASGAIGVLVAYKIGSWMFELSEYVLKAGKALFTFDIAAALPAIALGFLIVAIGLVIDELVNFYEGNETLIGQMSAKYPHALAIAWGALGLLSAAFIALKWEAISSVVTTIASVASLAVGWIASFASMAVATVAATWPILLILAALGLLTWGVIELMKHWGDLTSFMSVEWKKFTDLLTNFKLPAWLQKWLDAGMHLLPAGFHFGEDAQGKPGIVPIAPAPAGAAATTRAMPEAAGGVMGRAETSLTSSNQHTSTHTHTAIVKAPITIMSDDPQAAGAAAKDKIQQSHRDLIRNSQGGVGG